MKVNHPLVVRRVLLEGGGVSLLPRIFCTEALAQGQLVQVLSHFRFAQVGSRLTVVYPGRRLLSPRVRVFLEFLAEVRASISSGNVGSVAVDVQSDVQTGKFVHGLSPCKLAKT